MCARAAQAVVYPLLGPSHAPTLSVPLAPVVQGSCAFYVVTSCPTSNIAEVSDEAVSVTDVDIDRIRRLVGVVLPSRPDV